MNTNTRLYLETLEGRLTPSPTPADPFPGWAGEVRTDRGDLDGDGVDEWVAAVGPGGAPHVRVFWGRTGQLWREWYAYDAGFCGGVYVAVGDFDGDSRDDVCTGAGAGGAAHVRVWDGATGLLQSEWFAYDPTFLGGVRVAVQDTTPGGACEVLTGAGPGAAPHLRVWRNDVAVTWETFVGSDAGGVSFVRGEESTTAVSATASITLPEIGPGVGVWHLRPPAVDGPTLLLKFDDPRFQTGRLAWDVWLRVARLYQTVGVDVTTDLTAFAYRPGLSMVVLSQVPPNPPFAPGSGDGVIGLSYVGSWSGPGGYNQIAWARSVLGLGYSDERYLGLNAAHELAHTMGLGHSGPPSLMNAVLGGEYFLPWELDQLGAAVRTVYG